MNTKQSPIKELLLQCDISSIDNVRGFCREFGEKHGFNPSSVRKWLYRLRNRGIDAASESSQIDIKNIKHGWDKSSNKHSVYYTNPLYDPDNISDLMDSLDEVLAKYTTKIVRPLPKPSRMTDLGMAVTISDAHVGMNPNPDGLGLLGYEYNGGIYAKQMQKVFDTIVQNYNLFGNVDTIFIDDLGDKQDGWDKLTTRGGHTLDQNMNNVQQAETCIDETVKLIVSCVDHGIASKIILREVTNSNHSGDFSAIVNFAVKRIINAMYQSDVVEVIGLGNHINPHEWGDHLFLMAHGKDKKFCKWPLPSVLGEKDINYLNNYISEMGFDHKYVHVWKGDLHHRRYEEHKGFDYVNFTAFSPASAYIQHNFPTGKSGFDVNVFRKNMPDIYSTKITFNYRRNDVI